MRIKRDELEYFDGSSKFSLTMVTDATLISRFNSQSFSSISGANTWEGQSVSVHKNAGPVNHRCLVFSDDTDNPLE
jgi:hypothetical protein